MNKPNECICVAGYKISCPVHGLKQLAEAGLRRYSDTGQTVAIAIWTDGTSTTGDPASTHMQQLLARAKREGKLWPFEPAQSAERTQGDEDYLAYLAHLTKLTECQRQRDELLAAIKEAHAALFQLEGVNIPYPLAKTLSAAAQQVCAAIAKAEGRSE